jgi:DNA-binding response OmpR family regulator
VLLARISGLLRRARQVPKTFSRGALTLKLNSSQALVNGEDLGLSALDFKLLLLIAQNEDRLLTQEFIYEEVWGQPMLGDNQAVRVAVSRLRKSIAPAGYDISTVRNKGYVFEKM